jgi:hypothetical protein
MRWRKGSARPAGSGSALALWSGWSRATEKTYLSVGIHTLQSHRNRYTSSREALSALPPLETFATSALQPTLGG